MSQTKRDLHVFEQLLKHCVSANPLFGKETVVQSIACGQLLNLFIDAPRNIPRAQLCFPSIESVTAEPYLFSAYPGYLYGLQYLWYSILGRREFNRTCVKDLHLALNEEKLQRYPKPKNTFVELLQNSGLFLDVTQRDNTALNDDDRELIEGMRRLAPLGSERWATLDRFFEPINEQIVRPRQVRLKTSLGMSHLLVLKRYTKRLLDGLLDPTMVSDADYLTKTDRDSCKKQLALAMLWYEICVLDTQGLVVFNGAPAHAGKRAD